MSTTSPLIIVIDLDGTIIGDITPQIMTFDLVKNFKLAGYKFTHDIVDLRSKLKSGLVRPYFERFITSLSKSIPVEFFIYTASEKTWAELVIKNIEASYDIKFNRPIFARHYCIYSEKDREYKKSLSLIRPSIIKFLKKKYHVSFTKHDLQKSIMIVDNTNVYHSNDQKNLLLCPTYNYRVPENVITHIKEEQYKKHYMLINNTLNRYLPLSHSSSYVTFQKDFYRYYLSFLETQLSNNARYSQDRFWLNLRDIIITKNIRKFDETSIRYIANGVKTTSSLSTSSLARTNNNNSNRQNKTRSFF
jgi:hypothetical protein